MRNDEWPVVWSSVRSIAIDGRGRPIPPAPGVSTPRAVGAGGPRAPLVVAAVFAVIALGAAALLASATDRQAARPPLRIALLVDTSAATAGVLQLVRPAAIALIDAVPASAELLLVSTGRRTQVRVPPTLDRRKIKGSVQGLLADGGATPLIDALMEVDQRFMQKATDRTPVYAILTGDGSESSRTDGSEFTAWLRTLSSRHVAAHAVVLKTGNGPAETVVRAVCDAVGGHVDTATGGTLEIAMKALGTRISQDYDASR
jgi:VWA domain-containing protein